MRCWTLLILVILASGCGSAHLIEVEEPTDFRLRFTDGSWLQGKAVFHARLYLLGEDNVLLNLQGDPSASAAETAARWASTMNYKRPGLAEVSSNTILIHGVTRIEFRGGLRRVALTEVGPSS